MIKARAYDFVVFDKILFSAGVYSIALARDAVHLVQLSNTSIEWFIVNHHNAICSHYITKMHLRWAVDEGFQFH